MVRAAEILTTAGLVIFVLLVVVTYGTWVSERAATENELQGGLDAEEANRQRATYQRWRRTTLLLMPVPVLMFGLGVVAALA